MNIQTRNLVIIDDTEPYNIQDILYSGVLDEAYKMQFMFHSFYSVPNPVSTVFSFGIGYKTFVITELYLSNEFVKEIGQNQQTKIQSIKKLRDIYRQTSLLAAKHIVESILFHYKNIHTTFLALKKFAAGETQTLPYFPDIFYYDTQSFFVASNVENVFNPCKFFYHPYSGYCCTISCKN